MLPVGDPGAWRPSEGAAVPPAVPWPAALPSAALASCSVINPHAVMPLPPFVTAAAVAGGGGPGGGTRGGLAGGAGGGGFRPHPGQKRPTAAAEMGPLLPRALTPVF